MSNSETNVISISVMGREFKIKCPKDKIEELTKASDYLNGKMEEVKTGDKLISIDRVAITASLNIAHELILEKKKLSDNSNSLDKLNKKAFDLEEKINRALANEH